MVLLKPFLLCLVSFILVCILYKHRCFSEAGLHGSGCNIHICPSLVVSIISCVVVVFSSNIALFQYSNSMILKKIFLVKCFFFSVFGVYLCLK